MFPLLTTLAAAVAAVAVATAAELPDERLVAVTLDQGTATAYTGPSLSTRRALPGAGRAVLSPDARLVAYTRPRAGRVELRLAAIAGGGDRLLARLKPYDAAFAFSPDGGRIAYSSPAGIAIVTVGGAPVRRAVRLPAAWSGSRYSHLAFTPDGRRLLVSRTNGDGRSGTLGNELAVVELATGRGRTLYRSPNAYDQQARPASFTPDGSHVVVDGVRGIRVASIADGGIEQLTTPPRNGSDASPLVSPDGRLVAFARTPYRGVADIYVVGLDGSGLRRVTTTPIPPRSTPHIGSTPLAWSPDSTRLLAFRHDRFAVVDLETRAGTDLRRVGIRYGIADARWTGLQPEP